MTLIILFIAKINENFGLITANETNHWQLFASNISRTYMENMLRQTASLRNAHLCVATELNANAPPEVSYRVLYFVSMIMLLHHQPVLNDEILSGLLRRLYEHDGEAAQQRPIVCDRRAPWYWSLDRQG